MKNVEEALYFLRAAKTLGVVRGLGPSSNVRAMTFSLIVGLLMTERPTKAAGILNGFPGGAAIVAAAKTTKESMAGAYHGRWPIVPLP